VLVIEVSLPIFRQRHGYMILKEDDAIIGGPWKCLGKSDNLRAARANNPTRDPLRIKGDTPLGTYHTRGVSPANIIGIGDRWIALDPVSGDALTAKMNGRRGLGIHGGRGNDRLVPTEGCVRLFNIDFLTLAELMDGNGAVVLIKELASAEEPNT
jgi:hypothetical protein